MLMAFFVKSQTLVNSVGTPVTENFNSLTTSNTVSPWNQNSTLSGWIAYEMDPYSKAIDFSGDSGTSTGGRLYSYGRALSNDRALGSLCSGSNDSIVFGWRLKNNTGKEITSVTISYTGEQWRRTSGTASNKLLFFYKIAGSISSIDSVSIRDLTGNGFTYNPGLDFSSPVTGTTTSLLNGNDAANSKYLTQTVAVTIAPGEEIMLLWLDDDEAGNDHGLAIDNISVSFLNIDIIPPSVTNVLYPDTNTIEVSFSESVTNASATDTSNFKFSPYVKISSITYDTGSKTCFIKVLLKQGKYYTLSIDGLVDLASPANKQKAVYKSQNLVYNSYHSDKLIISEIFYNDPSTSDNYEFIEIANRDSSSIELGGLQFSSGIIYMFEEYVLESGKAICVAKNKDSCNKVFGTTFLGAFLGDLDNNGEKVVLSNSFSQIIDSVKYSNTNGWLTEADGKGASMQLKTTRLNSKDNDKFSSWFVDYRREFPFQKGTKIWASPDEIAPSLLAIDEIKQNDTNGINQNLKSKVEIRGTVYGINFDTAGLQFVMRDSGNGIVVFSPFKTFDYSVTEGDSIHVIGTVFQKDGLSIIITDTLIKKGISKIGLKSPTPIALPDENHEADLVKISNLKLVQNLSVWPVNEFVKFLKGSDTISVFIDKETDIDSTALPSAISYSITGFVFQSSKSPKLDDGYFLLPRSFKDIQFISAPQVSFVNKSLEVSESNKVLIELKILNSNGNATTISIVKKGGTALEGFDYNSNLQLTITFPALSDSNQSFSIPLINDVFDEPDKTLQLVIRSINNGGIILKDSILDITIQDDDNPLFPIKFASKINSMGVPDSNNVKAQVRGIVYGINYRPSGLQFTIHDSTGGIGIFHPFGNFGYLVTEGDEILVSGTIGHFRGLAQLSFIDTVSKLKSQAGIKSPVEVLKLNEFSESNLIKIKRLQWAQPKPAKWLANATYKFTNGKDTFDVRIDGDINLAETTTPAYDTINITGIGGQVSTVSTGPFFDGYLLYPRYISDIEKWDKNTSTVETFSEFVSVFPNPNYGNFEIISHKPITAICILSITGETVFNLKIPNLFQKTLDLNLPPGIYILKVDSGNEFAFKRILIK